MGHGQYVGRVGALAIALGIGAAVASGGIAQASPDDTGTGSESASDPGSAPDPGSPSSPGNDGGGAHAGGSDPADPPKTKVGSDPEPGTGAGTVDTGVKESNVESDDTPKGAGGTTVDEKKDAKPDDSPKETVPQDVSGPVDAGVDGVKVQADVHDKGGPAPAPAGGGSSTPTQVADVPTVSVASQRRVKTVDDPAISASVPAVNAVDVDTTARASTLGAAFTALAPTVAPPPPVFSTPSPIRFALSLLSAIGLRPEAFPPGSPLAPLGSLLEFVYAGLRRVDHTLFNESPTSVVLTSGTDPYTGQVFGTDPVTGVVTGRVAYDPDDELNWSVSGGPTYGTVEIHPDGTFTYMPDSTQVIPAGTTDSFSFTVTETDAFHLHLLSPGGHTATGTVTLNVLPNNAVVGSIETPGNPEDVAINEAGTRVYVTDRDLGKVHVIDTATNTIVASVPVGARPDGVTVVKAADGKEYVWVASSIGVNGDPMNTSNDIVTIIDTTTNTVVGSIDTTPPGWTPTTGLMGLQAIKANSDGSKVYVTGFNGVAVIDTSTRTVTKIIPMSEIGNSIAIARTPSGDFAYVVDYDDKATVIDMATDTKVTTISVPGFNSDAAASPDGRYVYVAGDGISVIDTQTNTVVGTIDGVIDARGLVVSPDGTRLYAARINFDDVAVIDTGTRSVIGMAARDDAWNLTVSPDGTRLYVVSFTADPDVTVIAVLPPPAITM